MHAFRGFFHIILANSDFPSRFTALFYNYPPYYPSTPAQQIVVNSASTQQSNGCATAGFVLSLIGFLLGFTLIFSVLGLILSIVGLVKAKAVNDTGKDLAIAGLVLGILSLIFGIFLFIWFIRLITTGISSFSGVAAATAPLQTLFAL